MIVYKRGVWKEVLCVGERNIGYDIKVLNVNVGCLLLINGIIVFCVILMWYIFVKKKIIFCFILDNIWLD